MGRKSSGGGGFGGGGGGGGGGGAPSISIHNWVPITWGTVGPILGVITLVAIFLRHKLKRYQDDTVDAFISARHRVGTLTTACALAAASLGSWIIIVPEYAASGGLLGISVASLSTGVCMFIPALFGIIVRRQVPDASSIADVVQWRFGPLAQLYVMILVALNMTLAMLVEYANISLLFHDYIGTEALPIILALGLTTLLYAMYGGLLTSLATTPYQCITTLIFSIIIAIFVGVRFEYSLPASLNSTLAGLRSQNYFVIFIIPITTLASNSFSDGLWQRFWAATTTPNLVTGASLAGVATILLTFGFGFLGFLPFWAGASTTLNPSLFAIFDVFKLQVDALSSSSSYSNLGALATVIATTVLSQAYLSSLQTGLMATGSAYFFRKHPLFMTRFLIFALNIPILFVAYKRYNIFPTYAAVSMICTQTLLPFLLGFIPALRRYYTGDMMIMSCIGSFLLTSGYGTYRHWDGSQISKSIRTGVLQTLHQNHYAWRYYLVALLSSLLCVFLLVLLGIPVMLFDIPLPSPTRWVEKLQARISSCWEPNVVSESGDGRTNSPRSHVGSQVVLIQSKDVEAHMSGLNGGGSIAGSTMGSHVGGPNTASTAGPHAWSRVPSYAGSTAGSHGGGSQYPTQHYIPPAASAPPHPVPRGPGAPAVGHPA